MKKIKSEKDIEKKKKKNQIIISVVMIALIGLSTLGYAVMNDDSSSNVDKTFVYAGIKFENVGSYWRILLNQKEFYFRKLPTELGHVEIEGNYSLGDYYQQTIYFVNPNAANEGLFYALNGLALRTQGACFEENCEEQNLPTKTCEDNLIIFRNPEQNETRVTKEENCVFIEGNYFDGVDRLIYKLINLE